jgi:ABC-type Fe3+/spermidine/putrescine transport system ATPase subunit
MEILMHDTKLEIRNISERLGNAEILKNVSFDVFSGEFLTILGPSGCGKTTLLRILIGLLAPDSGSVIKDGVDITALHPSKRQMGIVFQNYALFQNMTVLKNVEYALQQDPSLKANSRSIALNILEQVGLTEHLQKKPWQLSGGQQQRVAIARTLALNPDVVLLDEPMSALDAATRLSLRDELKHIQKKFNITMIYITHDQEEAFSMSDRIMVLNAGEIQQMGTCDEIVKSPANDFVAEFVVHNLKRKIESLSGLVS